VNGYGYYLMTDIIRVRVPCINFNAIGQMVSWMLLDERKDGSAKYRERLSHLQGYMDSCDGLTVTPEDQQHSTLANVKLTWAWKVCNVGII
jgi:hypothetical protein